MPKHPVPKKKTPKAKTSSRYKAFKNRAQARLGNAAQIVDCSKCGEKVQQHRACTSCGFYRGKDMSQVAEKEAAKVTTIKAD